MLSELRFTAWLQEAREDDVDLVVGALVIREDGKIFAQKRSKSRKLFPGCWDIAGGHVERDERLEEALGRELSEETGWSVLEIVALVGIYEWDKTAEVNPRRVRELDFLVRVKEANSPPMLEAGKVETFRWLGPQEVDVLLENRGPGDDFMRRLFLDAFSKARELGIPENIR